MFRYRCPHCTKLLQAPEVRAGKTTVCSKCSQPLTIPGDKAEWLNERGEPLLASPTVVIRTPPPAAAEPAPPPPALKAEADNDVLGALVAGELIPPSTNPPTNNFDLDVRSPAGMSSALNALLGNSDPAVPLTPPPAVRPALPPEPEPIPSPPTPAAAAPVAPPDLSPTPPPPERTRFPTPPPLALPRRAAVSEPVEPAVATARPTPPKVSRPAPRAAAVQPFAPQVSPSGRHEMPWAADAQGAPRVRRLVGTTPAPPRRSGGEGYVEPARGRSQADIAADLTSALTSRMKPPPRPRRDLKLSTALWLLATGVAAGLLVATLFTDNNLATAALAIGVVQVAVGYVWIIWLTARRDWVRGVLAAVPPLTAWYLGQWKYAKFRPLRFVVTGAALVGLALAAGHAQSHTRAWAGVDAAGADPAAPADPSAQRKIAQLRRFRDDRSYPALVKLLRDLARTDPVYSDEAKDKADFRAELRALCDHADAEVKVEALAAFATWGDDREAQELCLAAVRTDNPDARMMALRLLPKWKEERVAGAVSARLQQRPGMEVAAAQKALVELGGPVAERAAVPLLGEQYDQNVRLTAVEILTDDRVASPAAAAALRDAARSTSDPAVRAAATAAANRLDAKFNKK